MKRENFQAIRERIQNYQYTSLEHTFFEAVADYEALRDDGTAILLLGHNEDAGMRQMHFAVDDMGLVLDAIKAQPGSTLVSFVPPAEKQRFLDHGFDVYGEMDDYWMDDLTGQGSSPADICFLSGDEAAGASEVSVSVRGQSREFQGEGPEWVRAWMDGTNLEAADSGATDCAVLGYRQHGRLVGMLCAAIYGHESPRGKVVWIRLVAVRPESQGRGIGRKLVNQALSYGISKGAQRAFLMADSLNANAIGLYRSVGFAAKADGAQLDMVHRAAGQL